MSIKLNNWKFCELKYRMSIKDILYMLHWDKGLPIRNGIDKELDFHAKTISKWMKELKIKSRSISEDNQRRYSLMTPEQIKAQTQAANEAVRKNGQPKNIGRPTWCEGLTKNDHPGLLISSEKHIGNNNPMWNVCGKDHPQWTGGEKYWKHKKFIEAREQVKKRDNYTCQVCNLTENESLKLYKQPLQVHHIIPYRVCKRHNHENLITLCPSCHSKADNELKRGEGWKLKKLLESGDANLKQSIISQF